MGTVESGGMRQLAHSESVPPMESIGVLDAGVRDLLEERGVRFVEETELDATGRVRATQPRMAMRGEATALEHREPGSTRLCDRARPPHVGRGVSQPQPCIDPPLVARRRSG